jgi:O-antigen/teichoic acid export membrane protein
MAGKQLIKNSFIGIIQFILTAILTLISVPVFIHKLGMELYGIFAVVSVVGNLNLLANFGLNSALLVYVAKQGKCRESDHDIIVTQIIMGALTTIFTILAIVFSDFIIRDVFSIPVEYKVEAKNLLLFLVFANSFLLFGQTYTAIIDAKQKLHITYICQFIYSLIYWGGMILVLSLGGHLTMIGMIAFITSIIWFFLVMFFSLRIWGKLEINGVLKNFKKTAKKQLTYGFKIYLAGLTGFMFEPFSKILLSNFIGLNAVALFEIGIRIKSQINGLFSKAFYPLLPFIANSPDNYDLKSKVFDFSKKIQLIVIPICIVLVFILTVLTNLWLGNVNFEQASVFTITLTISMLLFSTPILPIYLYLAAKNKADKNIWIQFSSVVVNTILFITFYRIMGLYTILFSNSFAFLASYSIGNYYHYKYLGANFRKESPYYLKLIIFGITCSIACVLVRHFIPFSLWDLLIYPFIVGLSFIFFVRHQKLLTNDDMELYFGYIPFLKNNLIRLLIV